MGFVSAELIDLDVRRKRNSGRAKLVKFELGLGVKKWGRRSREWLIRPRLPCLEDCVESGKQILMCGRFKTLVRVSELRFSSVTNPIIIPDKWQAFYRETFLEPYRLS